MSAENVYILISCAVAALLVITMVCYAVWARQGRKVDDSKAVNFKGVHSIHEAQLIKQRENIELFLQAENSLVNDDYDQYLALKEKAIKMANNKKCA